MTTRELSLADGGTFVDRYYAARTAIEALSEIGDEVTIEVTTSRGDPRGRVIVTNAANQDGDPYYQIRSFTAEHYPVFDRDADVFTPNRAARTLLAAVDHLSEHGGM